MAVDIRFMLVVAIDLDNHLEYFLNVGNPEAMHIPTNTVG